MKLIENLTVFFSALCVGAVSFANYAIPVTDNSSGLYAVFGSPVISTQTLSSDDTELTLLDGKQKKLASCRISFDFVCDGSFCDTARIKNISVVDRTSSTQLYVLNDNDIEDFAFKNARACFGYSKKGGSTLPVRLLFNGKEVAKINPSSKDIDTNVCADIVITKDSFFQIENGGGEGHFSELTIDNGGGVTPGW